MDLDNTSGITGEGDIADTGEQTMQSSGVSPFEAAAEITADDIRTEQFRTALDTPADDQWLHELDPLDPKTAAQQYEVANLVQLPPSVLDDTDIKMLADRRDARLKEQLDKEQYADIYALANQNRFSRALTEGDTSNLARVLDTVDSIGRTISDVFDVAAAGWQVDRARAAMKGDNFQDWMSALGIADPLTPEQVSRRATLEAQVTQTSMEREALADDPRYSQGAQTLLGTTFDAFSNIRTQMTQLGLAEAVRAAVLLAGTGYGAVAGSAGGPMGTIAGGASGFTAAVVPAKAARDLTFVATTAHSEIGNAYRYLSQMTDEDGTPIDPQVAALVAMASGLASTAVEYGATTYAIGKLIPPELANKLPLADWAKKEAVAAMLKNPTTRVVLKRVAANWAKASLAEGFIEETTQNFVQDIGALVAQQASEAATGGEYTAPAPSMERFKQSVLEGWTAGWRGTLAAGLSIAPMSAAGGAWTMYQANRAVTQNKRMASAVDAVLASKTHENSKVFMQDFLRQQTGGKKVSLEPRAIAYLQAKGGDVYAQLKQLGATDADIVSAIENGTDIEVDAAALYVLAAEQKAAAQPEQGTTVEQNPENNPNLLMQPSGLLAFTRATPTDLTMAEVDGIDLQAMQARVEQEVAAATPWTQRALQNAREASEIEELAFNMIAPMKRAGTDRQLYADSESRRYAENISQAAYAYASRTGLTPMQFWGQHKVTIASQTYADFQRTQRESAPAAAPRSDDRVLYTAQQLGYEGDAQNAAAFVHATQQGMDVDRANQYAMTVAGAPHFATVDHYGNVNSGVGAMPAQGYMQPALHGTAKRGIDRFDTAFIGTGEGAQAYGWGLYFAGRREVAEWYREKLSARKRGTPAYSTFDGKRLNNRLLLALQWDDAGRRRDTVEADLLFTSFSEQKKLLSGELKLSDHIDAKVAKLREEAAEYRNKAKRYREQRASIVASTYDDAHYDGMAESRERIADNYEALKARVGYAERVAPAPAGQVYEVDIPTDDTLLGWDAPFSEQPEQVRQALLSMDLGGEYFKTWLQTENPTGRDIYEQIGLTLIPNSGRHVYQKPASLHLLSLGVKGLRYLDGSSRHKGEGSYNYVIFDGADAQIVRTFYQDNVQEFRSEVVADPYYYPHNMKAMLKQVRANTHIITKLDKVGTFKAPSDQLDLTLGLNASQNISTIGNMLSTLFRDDPQENLVAVVADVRGKITQVIQHRVGNGDSSTVGWNAALVGAAMKDPNARYMWLAHNHPSGEVQPSQADIRFNAKIREIVQATDQLEFGGHVIVGEDKFQFFGETNDGSGVWYPLDDRATQKQYKTKVPMTRRTMRRKGELMAAISSPAQAAALAAGINDTGVLLLNTQHQPVAFLPMDYEAMGALRDNRELIDRTLRTVENTNAAAAIVISLEGQRNGLNIGALLQGGDVRVLDTLYRDGVAEPNSRTLYSSANADGRVAAASFMQETPFDGKEVATTPMQQGVTEIDVDGVMRPALNSNGQLIHWSEEGTRNFWRWFGDSKVVDAQGRPLVVYHGSPDARFLKDDATFKGLAERHGVIHGHGGNHWFTDSRLVAKTYADDRRAFDYQNAEPAVVAAYLKMDTPIEVDARGASWRDAQKVGGRSSTDVVDKAKSEKADGVIVRKVRDHYMGNDGVKPATTFTVFRSTQIKSATGNSGAFDPQNPNILMQADAHVEIGTQTRDRKAENFYGAKVVPLQEVQTGDTAVIKFWHGTQSGLFEEIKETLLREGAFFGTAAKRLAASYLGKYFDAGKEPVVKRVPKKADVRFETMAEWDAWLRKRGMSAEHVYRMDAFNIEDLYQRGYGVVKPYQGTEGKREWFVQRGYTRNPTLVKVARYASVLGDVYGLLDSAVDFAVQSNTPQDSKVFKELVAAKDAVLAARNATMLPDKGEYSLDFRGLMDSQVNRLVHHPAAMLRSLMHLDDPANLTEDDIAPLKSAVRKAESALRLAATSIELMSLVPTATSGVTFAWRKMSRLDEGAGDAFESMNDNYIVVGADMGYYTDNATTLVNTLNFWGGKGSLQKALVNAHKISGARNAILPLYAKVTNPLVVDAQGARWSSIPMAVGLSKDSNPQALRIAAHAMKIKIEDYLNGFTSSWDGNKTLADVADATKNSEERALVVTGVLNGSVFLNQNPAGEGTHFDEGYFRVLLSRNPSGEYLVSVQMRESTASSPYRAVGTFVSSELNDDTFAGAVGYQLGKEVMEWVEQNGLELRVSANTRAWARHAQERGHDAIIFNNVWDAGGTVVQREPETVVALLPKALDSVRHQAAAFKVERRGLFMQEGVPNLDKYAEFDTLVQSAREANERGDYEETQRFVAAAGASLAEMDRDKSLPAQVLEKAKKNVEKYSKSIRGFAEAARWLPDRERQKLSEITAKKFAWMWRGEDGMKMTAAMALEGEAKRGWYVRSALGIMDLFGYNDAPRVASLMAAMSPQISVQQNVAITFMMFDVWVRAGRPSDPADIEALYKQYVYKHAGTAAKTMTKGILIALTAEQPVTTMLAAPKTDNFQRALLGAMQATVLDVWMARAFGHSNQNIYKGSATAMEEGQNAAYMADAAELVATADMLTQMTGKTWTAAEVQETVWSYIYTLYELRREAQYSGRSFIDLAAERELIDERIRSVPDVETLLFDQINGGGEKLFELLANIGRSDEDIERIRAEYTRRAGERAAGLGEREASWASGHTADAAHRRDLESGLRVLEKVYAYESRINSGLKMLAGIPAWNHDSHPSMDEEQRVLDTLTSWMSQIDGVDATFSVSSGVYGGDIEPTIVGDVSVSGSWKGGAPRRVTSTFARLAKAHKQIQALSMIELGTINDNDVSASALSAYPAIRISLLEGKTQQDAEALALQLTDSSALGGGATVGKIGDLYTVTVVSVPDFDFGLDLEADDSAALEKYGKLMREDATAADITNWRTAEYNRLESWVMNNLHSSSITRVDRADMDVIVMDSTNYDRYITDEEGRRNLDKKFDSEFGDLVSKKIQRAYARAIEHRRLAQDALGDAALKREPLDARARALNETLGNPVLYQPSYRGALDTSDASNYQMSLFETADRSTLPHELGHLFMFWLIDASRMQGADPSIGEMLRDTLEWVGADSIETMTREQHEMIADGFLNYAMTSKAPTMESRKFFDAYRRWLTPLHKRGLFQTVKLTPEARAVFDRMVATDEALEAYQAQTGLYDALVEASRDLYSGDDEREKFLALAGQAAIEAREALLVGIGEDMEKAERRGVQMRIREIRTEVEAALAQDAGYKALVALSAPPDGSSAPVRLNRIEVLQGYGQDAGRALDAAGVLSDGTDAVSVLTLEEAVARFGLPDADTLVDTLSHGDAEQWVEQRVMARAADELNTLQVAGNPATQMVARDALHNATAGQLLEQWRAMLLRKAKSAAPSDVVPARILQLFAERAVAALPRAEIRPERFAAGEVRAVKTAMTLHAKGDDEGAAQYARVAAYEHARFRAAVAAQKELAKLDAKIKRLNDKKARGRIAKLGNRALMQIDVMLARHGMLRRPSIVAPDLIPLDKWAAQMAEQTGAEMTILEGTAADNTPQKQMTLAQLRDTVSTLTAIEQQARIARDGLLATRKESMMQRVTELVLSAHSNVGALKPSDNWSADQVDTAISKTRSYIASHAKMEFVFRQLDGWQNQGVWWKTFYEPLMLAANEEAQLLEQANTRIRDIFLSRMSEDDVARRRTQRVYAIPEFGRDGGAFKFTHEELLSMLFNLGNPINTDRLEQSLGRNRNEILAILSKHLTAADLEIANEVWAALDELFWQKVSDVEEAINGAPPKKVEAVPFTVTLDDGTAVEMRGGYYPILYDSYKSTNALVMESKDITKKLEMPHARAMTEHGHREARNESVNKGLVLKLGMAPLSRHIANTAHDVTHALPLIDAYRMLNNKEVDNVLRTTLGEEMRRQFVPWLQAIANEYTQKPASDPIMDYLEGSARRGLATVAMGYKLTTALVQPLGYTLSADYMIRNGQHGARYALAGIRAMGDLHGNYEFMTERSVQMKNRREQFSREMRDFFTDESVAGRKINLITKNAMIMTAYTDLGVSMATWHGAYHQAMDGNANNIAMGDEQAAVEYADAAVRLSQGSGLTMDTAAVQRNHALLTMFSSYWLTMGGAMRENVAQFMGKPVSAVSTLGLLVSMSLQWFVPATLEGLMRDMFRNDDDDEEEKKRDRWATRLITYPFQQFIFVRDLANYGAAYAFSDYPPEYELTPVARAIDTTLRGTARGLEVAFTDDEASRRDIELFLDATGYALHLPTGQVKASGGYLYDVFTGSEPTDSAWRTTGGALGLVPADDRSKTK